MFRFIHAADVHLDSPLRGLERYEGAPVEEIRGATRRAFANLVSLAIEEEVAFVLLAGDLYDGDWRDYNTGLFFVDQMSRLANEGIGAYLIAGNHDAASQITKVLRPPANVHVFSTRQAETVLDEKNGVAIHGRGFATRAVTEDLAAGYPDAITGLFDIGLLHTNLDGRPGHDDYAPTSLDVLRSKGYAYWALGHVHQREVVTEDPWIVYPGNLQGRHIKETGAKGASLVTIDGGDVTSVEHRDCDVFRWARCAVDVADAESAEEALDRVEPELGHVIAAAEGRPLGVRVTLTGAGLAHAELHARSEHWKQGIRQIATGLGGDGVWIERVELATRRAASLSDLLSEHEALGGLVRSIQRLREHSDELASLVPELADLRKKLPSDVLAGEDFLDPTASESLASVLEDVQELLLHRLATEEPEG